MGNACESSYKIKVNKRRSYGSTTTCTDSFRS